jgi:hypothetical protein
MTTQLGPAPTAPPTVAPTVPTVAPTGPGRRPAGSATRVRAPGRWVVPGWLTGGRLAVAMVAAYAVCVAIEPLPAGAAPVLPWWYGAVDTASMATLVLACVAAARFRSWAPYAVIANGLLMIAETITCPASGHHHTLGWWWYAQWVVSLSVVATGAALARRAPSPGRQA